MTVQRGNHRLARTVCSKSYRILLEMSNHQILNRQNLGMRRGKEEKIIRLTLLGLSSKDCSSKSILIFRQTKNTIATAAFFLLQRYMRFSSNTILLYEDNPKSQTSIGLHHKMTNISIKYTYIGYNKNKLK